jgi:septal ring factor EnvC (AmiA/AmiB activator)
MEITKELTKFNSVFDIQLQEDISAAIAELNKRYMPLEIKGVEDKEGFTAVHEARMDIKSRRVEVTKVGKGLREDATAYNKAVIAEEKRIIGLLEPIEDHLQSEEDRINEEKERIKNAARLAEEARIKAREDRLFAAGMTKTDTAYVALTFNLPFALMAAANDEQFDTLCKAVEEAVQADRIKREAEAKELEALRIKAAEQQAELDRIAAEQKAEEDRLKKIEDEAKRAQEIEEAKAQAAQQAIKDKEEADKKEAAAAAKKAARAPDKAKLELLGLTIVGTPFPQMKTDEGKAIINWFGKTLVDLTKELKKRAGAL